MQVLNNDEFTQKTILIGQSGETLGFGVTNDPVLMSMLSTGLYKNPMKSMIQEICFNAWDAHRKNNCTDRPIDVYINEETGLIIRDYGKGIAPEDMHEIYCIYGASTKRDDSDQTGGFGLGSKSPYAFAESFMVTSHYQGKKAMYLMNRVSKENNGGPGMTVLMQDIPTTETGLMVTVPLEHHHREQVLQRLQNDNQYSGIKMNIHFEDEPMEYIEFESLQDREWTFDQESKNVSKLYAVYGGVSYLIEANDHYTEEFMMITKLARTLGTIYMQFPPDSLTPLPSREGLNFNESTMEIIIESIQEYIEPVNNYLLQECLSKLKESKIPGHLLLTKWSAVYTQEKNYYSMFFFRPSIEEFKEQIVAACPSNLLPQSWLSLCILAFKDTASFWKLSTKSKSFFRNRLAIKFLKTFPDISMSDYINHMRKSRYSYRSSPTKPTDLPAISAKAQSEFIRHCIKLEDELNINFIKVYLGNDDDKWDRVEYVRPAGIISSNSNYGSRRKRDTHMRAHTDSHLRHKKKIMNVLIRIKKDTTFSTTSHQIQAKKVIIIKTLKDLKKTDIDWARELVGDLNSLSINSDISYSSSGFYRQLGDSALHGSYYRGIPIIIEGSAKRYNHIKATFEADGYKVIEPEVIEDDEEDFLPDTSDADQIIAARPTTPAPKKPSYYQVDPTKPDWMDTSKPIEDPEAFICIQASKLDKYSSNYRDSARPPAMFINRALEDYPNMVIVHSVNRVSVLQNKGVINFEELVPKYLDELLKDKAILQDAIRISAAEEKLSVGSADLGFFDIPEIKEYFKLPFTRSKDKVKLKRYQELLNTQSLIYNDWIPCNYNDQLRELKNLLNAGEHTFEREYSNLSMLNSYGLRQQIRDLRTPGEVRMFAQKLVRFLKSTKPT